MLFKRPIVAVPPQYTSQKCSGCGERVKKSLSGRTHVCPRCKLIVDRDKNATINILVKGLNIAGIVLSLNTAGHAGINAWGDLTSISDPEMSQGQVGAKNRLSE